MVSLLTHPFADVASLDDLDASTICQGEKLGHWDPDGTICQDLRWLGGLEDFIRQTSYRKNTMKKTSNLWVKPSPVFKPWEFLLEFVGFEIPKPLGPGGVVGTAAWQWWVCRLENPMVDDGSVLERVSFPCRGGPHFHTNYNTRSVIMLLNATYAHTHMQYMNIYIYIYICIVKCCKYKCMHTCMHA